MTNAASTFTSDLWDWNLTSPQPNQDTELLKQLCFIPGLKEVLMVRQVHALEHGTVWVLSENQNFLPQDTHQADNEALGGLSTETGFYLYGQVNLSKLKRAVSLALKRLKQGEWDLAIHPRCGTNLSVTMVLTAGMVLGTHLLLPRGPIEQLLGLSVATTTAAQLAPDLGSLVQRYITTAVPFNLEVVEIAQTKDKWGRSAHFIRVKWRDLQ
ncbi:MAG: DUF6391 domain-containing protein [Spirulinaceae cyanobacterium]